MIYSFHLAECRIDKKASGLLSRLTKDPKFFFPPLQPDQTNEQRGRLKKIIEDFLFVVIVSECLVSRWQHQI